MAGVCSISIFVSDIDTFLKIIILTMIYFINHCCTSDVKLDYDTYHSFVNVHKQDEVVPFISSIFVRRLLQPGVYNERALRATLLEYSRHWTDSNFQSMTSDELKQEILSLIEDEVFFTLLCRIYLRRYLALLEYILWMEQWTFLV